MSSSGMPIPTEDEYHEALFHTFDLGDQWIMATNQGTLWPDLLPGSQMDSDDAETVPFQLSHIIQNLLSAAIEHLHALAALVRKAGMLHNSPPFTLGRAAVETAATAYWLLQPTDQKTRLWRHLAVVRQDTYDYEQVSLAMHDGLSHKRQALGPLPDFAKRRADTDRIKTKHHLTGQPNKLDLVRMLKEVDAAIATQAGKPNHRSIEIYWRTASGFGHGRQWSTIYALVREEVTPLSNATASVKISSTESRVFWGASTASELIERSLRLVYAACGHDTNQSA